MKTDRFAAGIAFAAAKAAVRRPAILGAVIPRASMPADLLLEVPPAYRVSLDSWLSSAAVVAEIGVAGVIVRADANRVFRLADLVTLVGEWMQVHAIDAVFATSDGTLFSIVPLERHLGRHAQPLTKELG
jgi:hypothetical protein